MFAGVTFAGSTVQLSKAPLPPPRSLSFLFILGQDIRRIERYFESNSLPIHERMTTLEQECNTQTETDPSCCPQDELVRLSSELTDFHGQLIAIQQWTLINITAVSKILKKHDKREAALFSSVSMTRKPCILKPSILKALLKQEWCKSTKTIQAMTTRVESMAKRCLRITMERSRLLAQRITSMGHETSSLTADSVSDGSEAESAFVPNLPAGIEGIAS
jgi:hypothetical protein